MATITNKILLKDKLGNILLPITRSTLVEMSSGNQTLFTYTDAQNVTHYLKDVDEALAYLHGWQGRQDGKLNNLIDAINDELPNAFNAYNIVFDNSEYNSPSSPLYNGGDDYEETEFDTSNVQGAIEALENKLATTVSEVTSALAAAGVTDAVGTGAITVTGTGTADNNNPQGSLTIGLSYDTNTLAVNNGQLTVNQIDASQVNYTSGTGDNITVESLDDVLDDIEERLSGVATDTNLDALTSRVSTLEGKTSTLETQVPTISLVKEQNSGDYAAIYTFTAYNGTTTTINIPKDQFLQGVEYVATAPNGSTPAEAELYPAMVFTWVVDTDNESVSPTQATTIIPVADLVSGAETKADTALSYLGVTRDPTTLIIDVPATVSDAIAGKHTIEEQIIGLDTALQTVTETANSALQGVEFNGTPATVTDNIAYITATGEDITVGQLEIYQSDPGAITSTDTLAYAVSKIQYSLTSIDNKIELTYQSGGTIEPISEGFAGFSFV